MTTPHWLLPLLVVFAVIYLARRISVMRALGGLKHGGQVIQPIPDEDIPSWLLETARPHVDSLVPHGFAYRRPLRLSTPNGPAFDVFYVEYTLPGEGIRAFICPFEAGMRPGECYITLLSQLSDGIVLATSSIDYEEIRSPLTPPRLQSERMPDADIAPLLERHRSRIATAVTERGVTLVRHNSPEADLAQEQANLNEQAAALLTSGRARVVHSSDGGACLKLKPYALLQFANRVIASNAQAAQRAKHRLKNPAPPPIISAQASSDIDWSHYREFDALQRGQLTWLPKFLLMIVSLVFFTLAMRWILSPMLAVTLVAGLVFHECGHLLGMRLFGHRDTQLLFLPFFGGAAVAHDPLVLAPWKHLVILFLGPLPGIFAGIAMMLFSGSLPSLPWLWEAGIFLFVFNAFNLLPILPLDGGQIADVALLSRMPHFRAFFMGVSALGLMALGFLSGGSAIILGILGLFMLIRTPVEWKLAGLVKRLRTELPPGPDEETTVRRLLAALRGPEWKILNNTPNAATQRLQHARALQERVRRPQPGIGAVLFALLGYTSPLWLCLPAAFVVNYKRQADEARDAEARMDAAQFPATPALLSFSPVADADNAAIPFLEALSLHLSATNIEDEEQPADPSRKADTQAIIRLLCDAARRPGFALPPEETAPSAGPANEQGSAARRPDFLRQYAKAELPRLLVNEARRLQRYNQPGESLELALDAHRLLRHLQNAPGWWSWTQHSGILASLQSLVEELSLQGAKITRTQLQLLADCTDERLLIEFATRARIAEEIENISTLRNPRRLFDSDDDAPSRVSSFFWKVFTAMSSKRYYAQSLDDAIRLRDALDKIAAGQWPQYKPIQDSPPSGEAREKENDDTAWDGTAWTINGLADNIAGQRLYRAGLAALWTLASKSSGTITQLSDIQAPWFSGDNAPPPAHPSTGATLRLETRGALTVLALGSIYPQYNDADTQGASDFVWRLPSATR